MESSSGESTRETQLAIDRIGKTPVEKLKWLVDFAALDLDALSAGRRADLGWEVVAFSFDAVPNAPADLEMSFHQERIREFHAAIKKGLDDFFDGNGWRMVRPEVCERLKVNAVPFEVDAAPFQFKVDKKDSSEWYHGRLRCAFELVKTEWERLQVCGNPKCRQRFVSEKKGRGIYCSTRCSNYIRVNIHRAKVREKTIRNENIGRKRRHD